MLTFFCESLFISSFSLFYTFLVFFVHYRTPVTTLDWMREAELKHGRMTMLAVLGWVSVDLGMRFPGYYIN